MPTREQTGAPWDDAACRFYGQGADWAALAVDLSQEEDNTGGDASAIFESSARFNHGAPRTMLWEFADLATTDTGTLWRHGTGANLEWLHISPNGGELRIQAYVNNAERLRYDIPHATLGAVWIAWASEANPDPDAAVGEDVVSWLYIHSVTGGWSERVRFVHPTKNSQLTSAYVGSSSSGGVNALSEQVRTFGFWHRLVSFSELADWHWSPRAVVPTNAKTVRESLALASGSVDVRRTPHGPAAQLASAATRHALWRSMGALSNEVYASMPTITEDTSSTGDGRPKALVRSDGYTWMLGWFRAYPVSPTASSVHVRVHARMWQDTPSIWTSWWGLRVFVMNRRPVLGQVLGIEGEPPEPLQVRSVGANVADGNHEDVGAWRIDAVAPLVRGRSGIARDRVYIALGYIIDPEGENPLPNVGVSLEVNAIQVSQLFSAAPGQPPHGGPGGEAG